MKFINNESIVKVDDSIVLGELHIGMESEMFARGFKIKSATDDMTDRIIQAVKKTKSKKIILLGDIKHNYVKNSKQEIKEIPEFFNRIKEVAEVHVCLGNHDSLLTELLPKDIIVHPSEGFLYKKNYFLHGNSWPSKEVKKAKRLFMAHIHPAIEFKDSLGFRHVEFCWVRGPVNEENMKGKYGDNLLEEIIIVPPFNKKIGGMPLNNFKERDISPITRNELIDIDKSDIYLLDGTHLGTLFDIQKS